MRASTAFLRPVLRAPRARHIAADRHRGTGAGPRAEPAALDSVIDCAAYVDGHRVDVGGVDEALAVVRAPDGEVGPRGRQGRGFVWVGLHQPGMAELEVLADRFGLHTLAVDDAAHAGHQRPKLERYDGVTFVVFKTCRYLEHERLTATSDIVDTGEIMVFLGPDFVITVRHGDHSALRPVRGRLEADPDQLALGPAAVLHAVADLVVDEYLKVAEGVQSDLDEVESSVFSPQRSNDVARIYHLKREIIELKRAVAPLAQPLRHLIKAAFVPAEIREYFRDVEDHLTRVREHVGSYDELLSSILQAHLAQVTVADNSDMRKISSWAAIMGVPTAVCAIYGMNFTHMPELHWRYGYPMVMALIVTTCALLYRGFRRNGWL